MAYKTVAKIIQVKGHCGKGHYVGQTFEVSNRNNLDMCGWLYDSAFPHLFMLRSGGKLASWKDLPEDQQTVISACPDRLNEVVVEMRRVPGKADY